MTRRAMEAPRRARYRAGLNPDDCFFRALTACVIGLARAVRARQASAVHDADYVTTLFHAAARSSAAVPGSSSPWSRRSLDALTDRVASLEHEVTLLRDYVTREIAEIRLGLRELRARPDQTDELRREIAELTVRVDRLEQRQSDRGQPPAVFRELLELRAALAALRIMAAGRFAQRAPS